MIWEYPNIEICKYVFVYVHIYIYTNMYIYIYMYIHVYVSLQYISVYTDIDIDTLDTDMKYACAPSPLLDSNDPPLVNSRSWRS